MNAKHVPRPQNRSGPPDVLLSASRVGWGLLLMTAPRVPLAALDPEGTLPPAMRRVVRVLGARHLAQGLLTGWRPSPLLLALGAGADALHAASALVYGAARSEQRRPATLDASIATALAVTSAVRAARSARGDGLG